MEICQKGTGQPFMNYCVGCICQLSFRTALNVNYDALGALIEQRISFQLSSHNSSCLRHAKLIELLTFQTTL